MTRKYFILGIILLFLLVISYKVYAGSTPLIKDGQGNTLPESIAALKKVNIGGIDQWILIRGNNLNNPILLFLHGGPGYPQIPYIRRYESELEKHFIVVNWDQRGAGLSYSSSISPETMTIEQFVSDTYHLAKLLIKIFKKKKIYLVGHSFGSVIGIKTAYRYPELFYAYIGIAQVSNPQEEDKISYDFVLKRAMEENNELAIKELDQIGSPPYDNDAEFDLQRKWLHFFTEGQLDIAKITRDGIFNLPEYTLFDGLKFIKGAEFTRKTMWKEALNVNLFNEFTELQIPIYFCLGRHDYGVPFEVSKKYFEAIKAPKKRLFWFESSAHYPHLKEETRFANILKIILESD